MSIYITLRQMPKLLDYAADWFHSKWKVSKDAYLRCMKSNLNHETEYGWYLCLKDDKIIGGLGVIIECLLGSFYNILKKYFFGLICVDCFLIRLSVGKYYDSVSNKCFNIKNGSIKANSNALLSLFIFF